MRKPRDYDNELKALEDKAKELKTRKVQQLGELVIASGADSFSVEELAGALLVLAETKDAAKREVWAKRDAAFFRGRSRQSSPASDRNLGRAQTQSGGAENSYIAAPTAIAQQRRANAVKPKGACVR